MLKYTLYTQNVNDGMKMKNYHLHFAVSIHKQTSCNDNVVYIYYDISEWQEFHYLLVLSLPLLFFTPSNDMAQNVLNPLPYLQQNNDLQSFQSETKFGY